MSRDVTAGSDARNPPQPSWARWTPALVVVVAAWVAALIVPLVSGAWWPIAVAPRIWHEHSVRFATDAISPLPIEGGSFVVQPWLSALAMWGAWEGAGIAGLSVLSGALASAAAVLMYRLARQHAPRLPAALAAALLLPLLAPHTLKNEQFAIALFALLLLVLGTRHWWWAGPVIVAVWGNVHGSVPIGVAACVMAALGMLRSSGSASDTPLLQARWRGRLMWLAACALAVFLNPLGVDIVEYMRDVREIPGLEALTPIWRPLSPTSWRGLWILAVLALLAGAVWRWPGSYRRPRLPDGRTPGAGVLPLLPVLVLAALAFDALRNVVWFAMVAAPELAFALGLLWQRRRLPPDITSKLIAISLVAVCAFAVVGLRPGGGLQQRFALNALPAERLVRAVPTGEEIFVSAEWADYLVVRRGVEVYVDARLERYSEQHLRAYMRAIEGDLAAASHCDDHAPAFRAHSYLLRRRTAGRLVKLLRNSGAERVVQDREGVLLVDAPGPCTNLGDTFPMAVTASPPPDVR